MKRIKTNIGTRLGLAAAIGVLAPAAVLAVAPAVALANTAWVNNGKPVKAPYNSCQNPGYGSVQAALSGPSTTVHVCVGTYVEQLEIKHAVKIEGESGVLVQLPSSPATASSACAAPGEQDLLAICTNSPGEKVRILDVTFEAYWPAGTCNDNLYGVNAGGGSDLELIDSTMHGAGAKPVNGCQGGVGVEIGGQTNDPTATATLTGDQVSGYQKDGIAVGGSGSHATIKRVTVTGAGLAPIAQNGIQVGFGATAKISEATISGSECNSLEVPSCGNASYLQLEEDGAGVLFYEEGAGSSVEKSTIDGNDLGVSHIAQSETTTPQVKITGDTFESDRYASVMLGQGYAIIDKDTMNAGAVGILLLQYEGALEWPPAQRFGPRGKGSEDTITGMTKYAIEGLSDLSSNDQFGSFTITSSRISGNPVPTVSGSVHTNNPEKLEIVTSSSDS